MDIRNIEQLGVKAIGTGNIHFVEIDADRWLQRCKIVILYLAAHRQRKGSRVVAGSANIEAGRKGGDITNQLHALGFQILARKSRDRYRNVLNVRILLGDSCHDDNIVLSVRIIGCLLSKGRHCRYGECTDRCCSEQTNGNAVMP